MRSIRGFDAIILGVAGLLALSGAAAEPAAGPTIDQAWQQLLTYDAGQADEILHVIERHVGSLPAEPAAKAQAAEKLAAVIAAPAASPAAKVFACKQLMLVGGETQVPLLAKMLDNADTAEIARHTLQAIPGDASLAALRGALERLKGTPQIGAINSLGILRDAGSVELLAKLLASSDAQVAGAAAEALGKIGTAPAAAALMKTQTPADAAIALHNAKLQCGERLAAAGDVATAATIFEQVWSSDQPPARRIGGLVGLARFCKEKAAPVVLEALGSKEGLVQATAVQLIRQLPGPQVTAGLVERLGKLDAAGQALLLGMLAERGDRTAADAVLKRLDDANEPIRVAAIDALAKLGDAAVIERLIGLAATGAGETQAAARRSLVRLTGAGVEAKLSALAAQGAAASRAEAIRAIAGRGCTTAAAGLLASATDADAQVRAAAYEALAALAPAEVYGKLVGLLAAAAPADMAAAERAVLAAGSRLDDPAQRLTPVIAAVDQAAPPAKAALLRVLGGFGGAPALAAVSARLTDADTTVRDAAVRSLAGWPDAAAAPELLKVAQTAENATHRALALRGYLRLAGEVKEASARLKMLEAIRPIATTAQAKRLLLAALSEAGDAGALHVATEMLTDADVPAEAAVATLKISQAVLRADPNGVRVAMRKLLDEAKDPAVREQATALDEEAQNVPSPDALQQALRYDKKRSEAQKAALAKRAPAGFELACYLDCGPDAADGAKDRPFLRLVSGAAYIWSDAVRAGDLRLVTINYDGQQVVFEATGLNPKKAYQVGFTWWDFDHNTRAQSVWAITGKGREVKLQEKTKLPSGPSNEPAAEKTVPLPPDAIADGPLRIVFRNESQPNVVVSELWLWESKADR